MTQTCSRCTRVNPPDASYCFHDGALLAGHSRNGGAIPVGAQPFASPFVFPSGRPCRSFDELALACQEDWNAARELLQEGYLESFVANLGRLDLAAAAKDSARFPDRDRGLDRFLGALPSSVLDGPKLRVEPLNLHLGVLVVGEDRRLELQLENQGMRLLYGSVTCEECDWLALGETPGAPEKFFQFNHEVVIPVVVKGKRLRAGTKPLEGRLVVESNGGTLTVTVRAEVPPKSFSTGVLQGAVTPRQIAEKAKGAPKEAAPFFEKGAVAQWYKDNGWTYPVQGPSASGLGAVQQFFEALGLTPPPKVDISERCITLQGSAGASLRHSLEVRSEEKRPVYAHATSDQPWLEVGRPRLDGRIATIPLAIPHVPDREGESLTARLTVRANGNQRFVVPVTLVIGSSLDFSTPTPSRDRTPTPAPLPAPVRAVEVDAVPVVIPVVRGASEVSFSRILPILVLLLVMSALMGYDFVTKKDSLGAGGSGGASAVDLLDPDPRLGVEFEGPTQRFGLLMLKEKDPTFPDKHKRLTFEEKGTTGNTCVKVEQFEYLFGEKPGVWVGRRETKLKDGLGWQSVFRWPEEVVVTQTVRIVPGQQTRLLDTCLVTYTLHNRSKNPRKVGLRVMVDTFIGANDGVPFVIPGEPGLLDTLKRFDQKDIPDYVQALERDDLQNPGTVAHLGLKLPDHEEIESMLISRWPGNKAMRWEIEPFEAMNINPEKKDSCVTLYWAYRVMHPDEKRVLAFTYGLNTISGAGSGEGQLALTAGGDFRPGREFTVTAYVKKPDPNQVVRLTLPAGFEFAKGQEMEQRVQGGDLGQASWRVRAGSAGNHTLEADTRGARANYRLAIRERSIY